MSGRGVRGVGVWGAGAGVEVILTVTEMEGRGWYAGRGGERECGWLAMGGTGGARCRAVAPLGRGKREREGVLVRFWSQLRGLAMGGQTEV